MIDNNFQVNKEERKVYPPLPKNIYQAELLDVSLVDSKGKFSKPGDKNFNFQWVVLSGMDKGESLRGRSIFDNFIPTSLYIGKKGKNKLFLIIEAFLGRELTAEEEAKGLSGFYINSLIGKQVKIFNDHKISSDGENTYNNITSYIPIEANLTPLTAEEKENCRVKKEQKPDNDFDISETSTDRGTQFNGQEYPKEPEISPEQIPF